VLRSATIARDQPILFSITTAGFDLETIGGELYVRGAGASRVHARARGRARTSRSSKPVERSNARSTSAGTRPTPRRPKTSRGEGGEPGVVHHDGRSCRRRATSTRPRGIYYRYHGNIWTRVETHWLKPGRGSGCAASAATRPASPTGAAARRRSSPATASSCSSTSGRCTTRARSCGRGRRGSASSTTPRIPSPSTHGWRASGPTRKTLTRRDREGALRRADRRAAAARPAGELHVGLGEARDYRILAVGADPMKFETQLQNFEDRGLLAIRFDQTAARMVPASEGLFLGIANRLIAHNGNEVLARPPRGRRRARRRRRPLAPRQAAGLRRDGLAVALAGAVRARDERGGRQLPPPAHRCSSTFNRRARLAARQVDVHEPEE
jgi:hypothetical protein